MPRTHHRSVPEQRPRWSVAIGINVAGVQCDLYIDLNYFFSSSALSVARDDPASSENLNIMLADLVSYNFTCLPMLKIL